MKYAISLNEADSQSIVDSAIRQHAQIVVESPTFPNTSLNGYIVSGDENALLIELTGRPGIDEARLPNAPCDVQLYCGKQYLFSSVITAAPRWGAECSVAMERPAKLCVIERRRSRRAPLAPSSTVRLEWKHSGRPFDRTVSLLNVSAEGLACRAEGDAVREINVGDAVHAGFQLPQQPRTYRLRARVVSKTPGSEGRFILGLQFHDSPDAAAQIGSLRRALSENRTNVPASEMCV